MLKHLWVHPASILQVWLHFLNFKENYFLRRSNVSATRAAEMTFNLFTLSAYGTLEDKVNDVQT
jgi:hypothetical protein